MRRLNVAIGLAGMGAILAAVGCTIIGVIGPELMCGGLAGLRCSEGEFCRFETGTCGAADETGVCTPIPEVCAEIFAPVCGCDDQTYGNECEAWANSVSVVSEGECQDGGSGAFCGGIAGVACGEGEYCLFEPGICGEGDQSGECEVIPEVCTVEFAPVCGCDNQPYDNDCFAAMAGVSVQHEGDCRQPG